MRKSKYKYIPDKQNRFSDEEEIRKKSLVFLLWDERIVVYA